MYVIQHKQSSWIQTGQTGGQTYSDTFSYKYVGISDSTIRVPRVGMYYVLVGFLFVTNREMEYIKGALFVEIYGLNIA